MTASKVSKLILNDYGSYLGMGKGCFVVKNKQGEVEKYPLFESEIGEIQIKSGNTVSSGAFKYLRTRDGRRADRFFSPAAIVYAVPYACRLRNSPDRRGVLQHDRNRRNNWHRPGPFTVLL